MIKRRVYTKEFKIEAIELTLDSGKTVKRFHIV
jgi:transposase